MKLRHWALLATLATFLLMLVGAYVVKTGAGLACVKEGWPFCNGRVLPPFESPQDANGNDLYTQDQMVSEWAHRMVAGFTGLLTLAVALSTFRRYRDHGVLLTLSVLACGLLFAQFLLGKYTVDMGNTPWTVVLHQGAAVSFFGLLVAILALAWRLEPVPAPQAEAPKAAPAAEPPTERRGLLETVGDYVALLKPRDLMLLLVSAVTTMLIASERDAAGHLDLNPWKVIATVIGGAMASGAGSAFNQWWERDLDVMMARTATRPVAAGRLPENHVLAFSASLGLGSFMVLSVFVNLLAAALALGGALFYILVYTLWLKRTGPNNIVIGGAAGSFPVLVGWAAVTGEVTVPALLLGFIVFLWTPPHFWSFALLYKEDYRRAGVPMLPVVRGDAETKMQIFLYTVALFFSTLILFLFQLLSIAYLLVSVLLGALFVFLAFDLLRHEGVRRAQRLFRYSILYLGLLFLYMAIDRIWIESLLA